MEITQPGGGGSGAALTVTDGLTPVSNVTTIDFLNAVTVTDGGGGTANITITTGGTGDVVGPASATDNAIARFDGTTGKLIQNSAATIADTSGNITAGTYNGNTIGSGSTSGTNTGDQTTISGNAGTATALQTGRTISISGDLTYTSPSFDGTGNVTAAGTLATVNSNVGSFTNASVTVNAKGLVTAASSGTAPVTSVSGTTNRITSTGGATPVIDISATFEALLGKVANPLSQFASTTSAQLLGVISDETGTGALVFANTPTLVTPVLGAATATSINGNTFTTGTYTLTGTAAKTLSFTNTLTLSGTDSTTMTFPTTSKTLAANDGSNWTFASQAIGDVAYASSTTAFTRLAAVATGSVLVSAGTGTAPAYSANPQMTTIELGAATDTTLARVSAGVISVEGVTIPTISSTNTLTNKRITRRISVVTQSATPTSNTDNGDIFQITGLAQAITSMTTNLSGSPSDSDLIEFQITDNATARAITWGTSFASGGLVALPTTTVISTMLRVLLEYQTTASLNKWVCVAVA